MKRSQLVLTIAAFVIAISIPAMISNALASTPAPAPPARMVNLSQGNPYTITQLVPTEYAFAPLEARYHLKGALTNGLAGSPTNFADGQWQGYDRGVSRSVIIDMGRVNTVERVQEDFKSCPDSSVNFPRMVTYSLSLNGKDWADVGEVYRPAVAKGTTHLYAVSGLNYRARYVRMTFLVDELIPYVGYENRSGKITDFMFDGFLFLPYAGNYIRSLGKVFDWIPYYQASGFAEYHSLGFDAAVMQPNYMFRKFPKQELGDAADADKKLGLGFELEVDGRALIHKSFRAKYFEYLNYGVTKGYMTGAVHMYYQDGGGGGAFYRSCISRDPTLRDIYDQTYRFIKGKYKYGSD